MSYLAAWIQTPLAQALGWTLLHFLWEGAVLAILLLAVLRIFRHAPARRRYALACTILAAMPLAFAATFAVLWARQPALVVQPPIPANVMLAVSAPAPVLAIVPAPARFTPAGMVYRLAWLVPLWFAGVLFFYLRSVAGWVAVQRLRRRGVCAVSPAWQARLDELAARLRLARPVRLLESCLTDTPVLIGYLRPVVLLPLGCLTGLSAAQVECILLHELAHVARHDYLVNLLQSAVEGLLFYHPAVWWTSRVVRTERENCCDDAVVETMGDARSYAAALATLEQRRAPVPRAAMAATGGNLMKRIRRLTMESRGTQSSALPAVSAGLLLVIFAAGLAAVPAKLPRARHLRNSMPAAAVQAGDSYTRWLNEDVPYIITHAEINEFRALTTDAERDAFIEQFWKRRDPTPGTAKNEFRDEHYRRIAFVNDHFGGRIPGWKTDLGRIYITYGPPDEWDDHSAGTASTAPFHRWRYRYIAGVGENVVIDFVDNARNGEFHMTQDPAEKQVRQGQAPAVALAAKPQQPLDVPYRVWLNADVAYIITDEERAAFTRFQTDAEREQFIADFWKQRDPTPGTESNEYREEHYRRMAYANEHFSTAIPGWKTDRGRVYIICGTPDSVTNNNPRSITWTYRYLEGMGNNASLQFEDQKGDGEFHLVNPPAFLAAPRADQEAKVFVAKNELAVSVIVRGRSHATGAIAVGDALDVTMQQETSVRNQNLINMLQLIANKNSECNALLNRYQPSYPAVASCSAQKAALERQRDQIGQSEGPGAAQLMQLKNEESSVLAQIQASALEVMILQRRATETQQELKAAREKVVFDPLIVQRQQAMQMDLNDAHKRFEKALQEGAGVEAEKARLAAAESRLTEFEKVNPPQNSQGAILEVQLKNSELINLNTHIEQEQQKQALLDSQLSTNRSKQAQIAAALSQQTVQTSAIVNSDGTISVGSHQVKAAGLTTAQLESALGHNASVHFAQTVTDKRRLVTVLVPLANGSGNFHVFGQIDNPRGGHVASFIEDAAKAPAMAKSVQLPAGTYHLTVVVSDAGTKQTRHSELDFIVD